LIAAKVEIKKRGDAAHFYLEHTGAEFWISYFATVILSAAKNLLLNMGSVWQSRFFAALRMTPRIEG